jgi:hypothetical protein
MIVAVKALDRTFNMVTSWKKQQTKSRRCDMIQFQ